MNEVEVLDTINEIGFLLLKHGAEIYRVEESMRRMCEAYDFKDIEVFALLKEVPRKPATLVAG
ncbi:MAG: threonine/serine exporter family protein [Erysipelotrichaceae bacterium]|nr:threonine/serine exporter family protein [Erysipelotrichaceae bacterium]